MSAWNLDSPAVDFDLSDEQVALRDAAAALLDHPRWFERLRERVGPGTVVGGSSASPPGPRGSTGSSDSGLASGYDGELWSAMVDQGWPGVERPESEGGLALGMVEGAVLCQQIGRRVAAVPFLASALALDALVHAQCEDAAAQQSVDEWVGGLTSGDAVGCVAWSAQPDALVVSSHGGRPHLSGRPAPVLYAPSASVAIVVAADGLYAVDLETAGRPQPVAAMDRTRELGWLVLDETPSIRLGGPQAQARLTDRAATGAAAEMLGGAERVLEMSVEYAKDRVQFGRPIGSFQAVKHRLADALVDVEGMRSIVFYAAWCVATGDADASLAASMAKSWCSDASRRVASSGLQVHGGIGFTWEHDLHLYLKRSQLDQCSFGDAGWHRDRVAGILRTRIGNHGSTTTSGDDAAAAGPVPSGGAAG